MHTTSGAIYERFVEKISQIDIHDNNVSLPAKIKAYGILKSNVRLFNKIVSFFYYTINNISYQDQIDFTPVARVFGLSSKSIVYLPLRAIDYIHDALVESNVLNNLLNNPNIWCFNSDSDFVPYGKLASSAT